MGILTMHTIYYVLSLAHSIFILCLLGFLPFCLFTRQNGRKGEKSYDTLPMLLMSNLFVLGRSVQTWAAAPSDLHFMVPASRRFKHSCYILGIALRKKNSTYKRTYWSYLYQTNTWWKITCNIRTWNPNKYHFKAWVGPCFLIAQRIWCASGKSISLTAQLFFPFVDNLSGRVNTLKKKNCLWHRLNIEWTQYGNRYISEFCWEILDE